MKNINDIRYYFMLIFELLSRCNYDIYISSISEMNYGYINRIALLTRAGNLSYVKIGVTYTISNYNRVPIVSAGGGEEGTVTY